MSQENEKKPFSLFSIQKFIGIGTLVSIPLMFVIPDMGVIIFFSLATLLVLSVVLLPKMFKNESNQDKTKESVKLSITNRIQKVLGIIAIIAFIITAIFIGFKDSYSLVALILEFSAGIFIISLTIWGLLFFLKKLFSGTYNNASQDVFQKENFTAVKRKIPKNLWDIAIGVTFYLFYFGLIVLNAWAYLGQNNLAFFDNANITFTIILTALNIVPATVGFYFTLHSSRVLIFKTFTYIAIFVSSMALFLRFQTGWGAEIPLYIFFSYVITRAVVDLLQKYFISIHNNNS